MDKERISELDKKCKRCEKIFKRTRENFYNAKGTKDKLMSVCKICDCLRRSEAQRKRTYHNIGRRCVVCNTFFYAALADMNKVKRKSKKEGGVYCSKICQGKGNINKGYMPFGRKGISWNGKRRGINNPFSKHDIEKVIQAKKLLNQNLTIKEISEQLDLKISYVSSLKYGKVYGWLNVNEPSIY